MADIKLIGLDLDGTLLTSNKTITAKTTLVLKQLHAKGYHIAIMTGRPIAAIGPFIEQLGLTGPEDYSLTFNGALVLNNVTRKSIAKLTTTKAALAPLHDWLKEHHYPMDILDFDQNWQMAQMGERSVYASIMKAPLLFEYVPFSALPDRHDYAKAVVATTQPRVDQLVDTLPTAIKAQFHIVRSQPQILEFLQPILDKRVGVQALTEYFQLTPENVMVFGDAENDLGMFDYAKYPVAMANGTREAKAAAVYVTPTTNDEDGIANFLTAYFKL
ncbi:Cof subfamily protein (haloacid dehalogenase superfamily) [Weissella beninensis]|uniref:HAD family phosphatase n=1 Tax=Periweissella beninensis TaxID=504936 RepID=A0ABT0VIF8_9LACO|nr:Cof-type HAD-IIB family hydrolase [Periweissella beninensis]MBM7543896.1 Cof subfamily protein (haloacid dehalogenase superfamily) [Periweissella beninensis]MCM2437622.1 HAD family phosphatase [Periweissella beninensis]